jgi:hypothetical protein
MRPSQRVSQSEKGAKRGIATDVLDLVFIEGGDGVDDNPWQRATKVDDLVHDEAHDASREDVVLHPEVPSLAFSVNIDSGRGGHGGHISWSATYSPEALRVAKLAIEFRNLVKNGGIGRGWVEAGNGRVPR